MSKHLFATLLLCFLISPISHADSLIYRVSGVSDAIDDIAQEINRIIDRLEKTAHSVIQEGGAALEERLVQVDVIVDDALNQLTSIPKDAEKRILNVLSETERSLLDLEQQFFDDVEQAIYKTECAAGRFTLGTLQAALGGLGEVVGAGQIKIRPPLEREISKFCEINPFCSNDLKFEIRDNFESTAIDISKALLDALSQLEDDDDAYAVIETYNYLSLLSRRTACFIDAQANSWVDDYIKYTNLSEDWYMYVNPVRR